MSSRNAADRHCFRARHQTSHTIVEARAIDNLNAIEDSCGQEAGFVFDGLQVRSASRAYNAKAEEQLRAWHEHWDGFPEARH